jgi:hypothetical protein
VNRAAATAAATAAVKPEPVSAITATLRLELRDIKATVDEIAITNAAIKDEIKSLRGVKVKVDKIDVEICSLRQETKSTQGLSVLILYVSVFLPLNVLNYILYIK